MELKNLCPEKEGLRRAMRPRHILMISLGGTIGTGLFMGSGYTISQAGPIGALLSYTIGGLIMYLVLLCLAELAVAMPVAGSFQSYASKFISPAAGFTTGWLYWVNWALCIGSEFTISGMLMQRWFPDIPVWIWCIVFALLLTLINALSVKAYGEAEFWFAGIKVAAILFFIIVGCGMVLGLGGKPPIGYHNYVLPQIFPKGGLAVIMTMIAVSFSFQGSELIGIAAGECENPGKSVPRAIKGVTFRIVLFYVFAIAVLAAILPWQKAGLDESPFATVFGMAGIPYAADIMTFVVITSALSAGNSALYGCSRLLWSLSKEGMAPAWLGKLNRFGVPLNGVIFTVALAGLSLLTSVYAADTVYLWLMSSTGMTGVLIWMIIAVCQYNFRKQYLAQGGKLEDLAFRTPLYPIVPILAFVCNGFVLLSLVVDPSQRVVFYSGMIGLVACYLFYYLRKPGVVVTSVDNSVK